MGVFDGTGGSHGQILDSPMAGSFRVGLGNAVLIRKPDRGSGGAVGGMKEEDTSPGEEKKAVWMLGMTVLQEWLRGVLREKKGYGGC